MLGQRRIGPRCVESLPFIGCTSRCSPARAGVNVAIAQSPIETSRREVPLRRSGSSFPPRAGHPTQGNKGSRKTVPARLAGRRLTDESPGVALREWQLLITRARLSQARGAFGSQQHSSITALPEGQLRPSGHERQMHRSPQQFRLAPPRSPSDCGRDPAICQGFREEVFPSRS